MARRPYLMTTTLWDFPSQQYGDERQGDQNYAGATPAYLIWNLLQRYTQPGDVVVDPMAGSGTTLDVARELGRQGRGFDLQPTRDDIARCDARKLPMAAGSADFVFVDPPYSTHLTYSGAAECIGEFDAATPAYYEAMERVMAEMHRILRPGRYLALYVSDSFRKGKPFCPIGFELFDRLRRRFEPVDVVAVVRRNKTLLRNHWHTSAIEGNYYLRGFNYLFILKKADAKGQRPRKVGAPPSLPWGPDAKSPSAARPSQDRPGPGGRRPGRRPPQDRPGPTGRRPGRRPPRKP